MFGHSVGDSLLREVANRLRIAAEGTFLARLGRRVRADRGSFISGVRENLQSSAIVRAIINLGRGLRLPVVAEGVETKDQLEFLSDEACDEIQGYLIGRPKLIYEYAQMVGRPLVAAR